MMGKTSSSNRWRRFAEWEKRPLGLDRFAVAGDLRAKFNATLIADFLEEAADAYEARGPVRQSAIEALSAASTSTAA